LRKSRHRRKGENVKDSKENARALATRPTMRIRRIQKKDCGSIRRLFDEAYDEYLKFLRVNNPERYVREKRERKEVAEESLDFFLKAESSFVAEEKREVIGCVISRTISDLHGINNVLVVEYIAVRAEHRRRGVGTALFHKLIDFAKRHHIEQIYETINPDNEASIKLAQKVGFNVEDWKAAILNLR
jgi:L-amino acid N-acyltransferase YncA